MPSPRTILPLLPVAGAAIGMFLLVAAGHTAGEPGGGAMVTASGNPPERVAAPVADSGAVAGQIVVGTDDRFRITDTAEPPWQAIAFLELYDGGGEFVGSCTGTFIGPDAVLTAGHCLWDPDDGWTGDIAVIPGKNGDAEPFGFEWAEAWWVPDAWIDTGAANAWDWGIIKLPTSDLGDTVGWFTVGNLATSALQSPDRIPAIFGYPGDANPPMTMWGSLAAAFLAVSDTKLIYDIDTTAGESGAAVLSLSDDEFFGMVVGVHTTGIDTAAGPDFNVASRINDELLDDILLGCQEMGCTIEHMIDDATPTPTPTTAAPTPILPDADFLLTLPEVARDEPSGPVEPLPTPLPDGTFPPELFGHSLPSEIPRNSPPLPIILDYRDLDGDAFIALIVQLQASSGWEISPYFLLNAPAFQQMAGTSEQIGTVSCGGVASGINRFSVRIYDLQGNYSNDVEMSFRCR